MTTSHLLSPRRRRPARNGGRTPARGRRIAAASVVLAAATVACACAGPVDSERAAGSAAAADRTVSTPCFSFDLPASGWEVVPGTTECLVSVRLAGDALTEFHVRAQEDSGSAGELAAVLEDAFATAEATTGTVDIAGREFARARVVDARGLVSLVHLLPVPEEGLTAGGRAFGSVWISGPSSPALDEIGEGILASLEIVDPGR